MTRPILTIFPGAFGKRPLLITIITPRTCAFFARSTVLIVTDDDSIRLINGPGRFDHCSEVSLSCFDIPDLILSNPRWVNVESSSRGDWRIQTVESRQQNQRPTRYSCGWLYVEKKVDKLSPGSLKAWAERSTHSSRPLLFFLPLSHLCTHPPSLLTHHHLLLLLLRRLLLFLFLLLLRARCYMRSLCCTRSTRLSHSLTCSLYFSYVRFTSTL